MIDIVSIGNDIGLFDSQVSKAGNILSVQLGALEYAPDLGIDLRYFLSEDFRFQNESFKAYLVERLSNSGINVVSVLEMIENLYADYTFNIGGEPTNDSLVSG